MILKMLSTHGSSKRLMNKLSRSFPWKRVECHEGWNRVLKRKVKRNKSEKREKENTWRFIGMNLNAFMKKHPFSTFLLKKTSLYLDGLCISMSRSSLSYFIMNPLWKVMNPIFDFVHFRSTFIWHTRRLILTKAGSFRRDIVRKIIWRLAMGTLLFQRKTGVVSAFDYKC